MFHTVLGFLGSSDRILCHYSPPRYQEWTIIYWLQLLCSPGTKKINEIMCSHPLSRDFLGLFALFYHNLTLIDEVLLTNLFILLSGCSCLNSWPAPDAWLQVEADLSCLLVKLHPDIPPEHGFPMNSNPFLGFPASSLVSLWTLWAADGHCWTSHHHICPQASLTEHRF